jgi:hypothetical protein
MSVLSRRTVLRGFGAALALPWLEAMVPLRSLAPATRRVAFLFVPNGVHIPDWSPTDEGKQYKLPYLLEPLAEQRESLLVLSGLTQDKARANGDGPGDHARSSAAFLTGAQPKKTAGDDIHVGVSVDQVAAQKIGAATRFRSLELGCEAGRQSGQCDSGYACVYSSNISWKTARTPNTKEVNPRLVFDRLFGFDGFESAEDRAQRARRRKSLLDLVGGDAKRLGRELGASDRHKLDEYLSGVRELERRIDHALKEKPVSADIERPIGIPDDYGAHIRLMSDLLVLAFQSDLTRIATFMYANEGSNRTYGFLGVPEGHHTLSHHGGDHAKEQQVRKINRFHTEQLAYFLKRLQDTREGDANLLDNSLIVYGSGIGDGNRHNHDELPFLLAGSGGGFVKSGRHLRLPRDTPANNLYLSLLDYMQVPTATLGDSSGRLSLS